MNYEIVNDNIYNWIKTYSGAKFHALFSDPPYEMKFMGNLWDGTGVSFDPEMWAGLLNHLHDGAFGLVYGGSRSYHRLAAAIEDAGAIIHPSIFLWARGQGMPHAVPVKNEKIFKNHRYGRQVMKPNVEPVVLFQKPYNEDYTLVENIKLTGAGTLNIDNPFGGWPGNFMMVHNPDCEIVGKTNRTYVLNRWSEGARPFGGAAGQKFHSVPVQRVVDIWRCSDGCPVANIGSQHAGAEQYFEAFDWAYEQFEGDKVVYASKPNKKERDSGLEDSANTVNAFGVAEWAYGEKRKTKRKNFHATVKPISADRRFAYLLLPPKEYTPRRILNPFSGSGSEMIGSFLAGWDECVGIENESPYVEIAQARLKHWVESGI